jgi:hypothetical protein
MIGDGNEYENSDHSEEFEGDLQHNEQQKVSSNTIAHQ